METLNKKLINHYDCFNRERFWLDEDNEEDGFISIVSSITDTCPIRLCRGIAKFIKKNIQAENYDFIYVGAWVFKVSELN